MFNGVLTAQCTQMTLNSVDYDTKVIVQNKKNEIMDIKIGKLIDDILAAKEIYIARYYIKKEKWIAAVNRLKFIVNNYGTTIFVEEALHRLVEIYYILGLESEARKSAKTLLHFG